MVTEDRIRTAVATIKRGGTVIYPTETVYGLGADAFSEDAVRKVYKIKNRDFSQPLSVAVSSFEMLQEVAFVASECLEVLSELLPGPVTVLLRRKAGVAPVLTAGSAGSEVEVVGVRFPENEVARRLIEGAGPLTATSANLSGRAPPTCVEEVEIKADIILNGGKCKYSVQSTVVDFSATATPKEKKIEIKRRGAGYERILHILRRKVAGEGLHGLSVP
ncbi:MAG: threonylcarbamoyl-AMP synthase [Candidatus Methanophagaceae archaeon]|nr:MAG: threonylcarbamoyl-AMP synthase [Methanophagales archaeon]